MGEIPKYHFSHRFSELVVGELFADVRLVCQDEQVIPCHRIVLAAHSHCLQTALADSCEMLLEDSVVMLPDFSSTEVHHLVQVRLFLVFEVNHQWPMLVLGWVTISLLSP